MTAPPPDDIFGGQAALLEKDVGPLAEVAEFLGLRAEELRQTVETVSSSELITLVTPFAVQFGIPAEQIAEHLKICVNSPFIAPYLSDDIN